MPLRTPVALTAGVAAAVLTAGCAGATAGPPAVTAQPPETAGQPPPATTPTVVLVHGAFADSSSWNGVVKKLEEDGYPVVAAANPLRGLHVDAEYMRSVLDSVSGPVVVAGHSYGGSVMSEAADGHPNVKGAGVIASFSPEQGESTPRFGVMTGGHL